MKHIFVVHSNITYLAALGVVTLKKLELDNVLFVSQHFVRSAPIPVVPIRLFSRNLFRPCRFFNFAHRVDRLIDQFIQGQSFRAYVPALTKPAKVIVTHNRCLGFDFIEEGIGSYLRQFPLENHTYEYRTDSFRASCSGHYLKRLAYGLLNLLRGETPRLTALPINYTSYAGTSGIGFYGFHASVFPLADHRELLDFRQITKRFDFSTEGSLPDEACVVIGEGLFSLVNGYSVDQYTKLLEDRVVPWLKQRKISSIYLKHHYNESQESMTKSLAVFTQANIDVQLIDRAVILEMVLLRSRGITLFGYSSSLLFYGALMGCRSYSYCDSNAAVAIDSYWHVVERIEKQEK